MVVDSDDTPTSVSSKETDKVVHKDIEGTHLNPRENLARQIRSE